MELEHFRVGLTPTLFYIPDFINDEELTQLKNHMYGASDPKWKTLKNRDYRTGVVWSMKRILFHKSVMPSWLTKIIEKIRDRSAILSLGSRVVMDFSPHPRLRSDNDYISRDQSPGAESCVPERDSEHSFSVLMMPRSLLIFKGEAYADRLHGISDSPRQCYNQVVNEAEALTYSENSNEKDGDKVLHRDQTRVSLVV